MKMTGYTIRQQIKESVILMRVLFPSLLMAVVFNSMFLVMGLFVDNGFERFWPNVPALSIFIFFVSLIAALAGLSSEKRWCQLAEGVLKSFEVTQTYCGDTHTLIHFESHKTIVLRGVHQPDIKSGDRFQVMQNGKGEIRFELT
jgi:hypothetical protein